MVTQSILEFLQLASLSVPIDLQGAANQATIGDWINLEEHHRCAVIFMKNIGTAGDDPILVLQQATSAAGAGAKALTFSVIYRKESTVAAGLKTVAQWTRTQQTAATSYTNDTSAESELFWVVDIKSAELDVDNGFKFVNATVADVGGNAQLGALIMAPYCPRNALAAASMLGVLA